MKRKIVLSLAMSLDGYIATKEGAFDWINGDGDKTLDTKSYWDFNKFLETVDTVVMGGNCYKQGFHKDFASKKVYVATSKKIKDQKNLHFINGDIVRKIFLDTEKSNRNVFIYGGGELVNNFLQSNIIDEYYIGVVPIILGDGIPLFRRTGVTINLHLVEIMSENGIVVLKYTRR